MKNNSKYILIIFTQMVLWFGSNCYWFNCGSTGGGGYGNMFGGDDMKGIIKDTMSQPTLVHNGHFFLGPTQYNYQQNFHQYNTAISNRYNPVKVYGYGGKRNRRRRRRRPRRRYKRHGRKPKK